MAAKKKAAPKNSSNVSAPTSATQKAGKDARSRAKKYGTPVGATKVKETVAKSSNNRATSSNVRASTMVKSARGNMYEVVEKKTQNVMARDSKPVTSVYPVAKNFTTNKKATNQKTKKK